MSKFKQTLNKKLGDGTVFSFGDSETLRIQPVPTGIPSLDYALGIGGFPLGRIVEIYGPESSGKTTVALQTIAKYQELAKNPDHPFSKKKEVLYIDAENALDPVHVENIGVDVSDETGMLINQPDYGEQAFDTMETAIHSGEVGLIVVDSVANLVPKKELEGSNEDQQMGLLARIMSKGLRKITGPARENNTLIIFINQIREKVGVMYGNPETTPGGRSLRFYASVRMHINKKEIKKGDVVLGHTMNFNIKKNKVARPFTKSEVDYYYDTLFDMTKDIMNVAMGMGIINRAGAYYYYGQDSKKPYKDDMGNELKWMGKDSVELALKQSPALFKYTNDIVQGRIPKDAQFVDEEPQEEPPEELLV
ncbi:recombinase RecA [Virgibacillus salexigens]|uniref:Protein RecA n=1 Tax=Virgibacillus massiliensis TaxID=1462526 RepID=A0A024QI87_9BACI|nr:recombinase RecA [Virgibacillus massiliensis]CDQ41900.1 Recombinase A [Virgibacillus massiliensis]